MDPDRLREGSVDYVRHGEIVDVRLRVKDSDGRASQEYIRFVGPPVARTVGAEIVKERDDLKAEVDRLKAELDVLRRRGIRPPAPAVPKPQPTP